MGAKKRGVKILCVAAELKNRGQKSICGHKKWGQYSMSHWKIGVKILCSKSWEGQNSMKAKIWGQNFIFFSWNPWSKFYVPWKGGSKFYIFSQCLEKGGSKPRSLPTNFTEGVPPPPPPRPLTAGCLKLCSRDVPMTDKKSLGCCCCNSFPTMINLLITVASNHFHAPHRELLKATHGGGGVANDWICLCPKFTHTCTHV